MARTLKVIGGIMLGIWFAQFICYGGPTPGSGPVPYLVFLIGGSAVFILGTVLSKKDGYKGRSL